VYGIVSRSYPFTGKSFFTCRNTKSDSNLSPTLNSPGKILKGFLDASGTLNGQGIGNPNAEFSPDVTTVALHSAGGGTVRVSWGFRSGEVALTTSPRVMELGKHSKLVRCSIADSHIGIVQHVLFGESAGGSGSTFISAGVDGRIKLWEADPRRLRCAWTGVANSTVVPEVCTKVAYSAACGLVVAGMQSGELVIWTGLRVPMAPSPLADAPPVLPTYTLRIPPPDLDIPLESLLNPNRGPRTLLIEPTNSADSAIILVHYEGDDHFYKINVIFTEHTSFTLTRFCDGPLGPIVVIKPDFATSMRKSSSYPASQTNVSPLPMAKREESSYILSGDVLGRVCIWPWDIEGRDAADMREVPSSTKFEAHDDGQVTAIEVGMTVLITGR
jgi:WD40 repeat protein